MDLYKSPELKMTRFEKISLLNLKSFFLILKFDSVSSDSIRTSNSIY